MNSQQTQKQNSEQAPSFDDVSKLFALPLSEAADILGVSAAELKKICSDNGLERWPHRKYLAGKSVEEIKKEAATAKERERNNKNSIQIKDKLLQSPRETSKQQQTGSRSIFTSLPSNYGMDSLIGMDEFKYGYPSDGLSVLSNKWWGSSSPDDHDDTSESVDVSKLESDRSMSDDGIQAEGQQLGALTAIRKRALEEGRETLELDFWKEVGVQKKVRSKEKLLLTRIFG